MLWLDYNQVRKKISSALLKEITGLGNLSGNFSWSAQRALVVLYPSEPQVSEYSMKTVGQSQRTESSRFTFVLSRINWKPKVKILDLLPRLLGNASIMKVPRIPLHSVNRFWQISTDLCEIFLITAVSFSRRRSILRGVQGHGMMRITLGFKLTHIQVHTAFRVF